MKKKRPVKCKAKKSEPLGLKYEEVEQRVRLRLTKKFKPVIQHFNKWMNGQTRPVLEDGTPGYFEHDVERFLDMVFEGRTTYFD